MVVRESTVTSDGGEKIEVGEQWWSRINGGDNNFSDNSGYNNSDGDNRDEIQEISDSNSLHLNP